MKKRKVNKETKAYQKKELRRLRNKCLTLWKRVVKKRAGGRCEACGRKDRLNAAHIESYELNKNLRYDLKNGVALCPTHHKWGKGSFHKSLCFALTFMIDHRKEDLKYLLKVWNRPEEEQTREYFLNKIQTLEKEDLKYT